MLAGAQSGDDLRRMQRHRRDEEQGVETRMREQIRVVLEQTCHAQRVARPLELLAERTARGDEFGAGHAEGQVLGVAAPHAAHPDDTDVYRSNIAHWLGSL